MSFLFQKLVTFVQAYENQIFFREGRINSSPMSPCSYLQSHCSNLTMFAPPADLQIQKSASKVARRCIWLCFACWEILFRSATTWFARWANHVVAVVTEAPLSSSIGISLSPIHITQVAIITACALLSCSCMHALLFRSLSQLVSCSFWTLFKMPGYIHPRVLHVWGLMLAPCNMCGGIMGM